MSTVAETARASARAVTSVAAGPVVVATDGRSECAGPIDIARRLARRLNADIAIVAVCRPHAPIVPHAQFALDYGLAAWLRSELTQRVRSQCALLADTSDLHAPHIDVREGEPTAEIARFADKREAQLIVLGLGHHEVVDRIFGDETALKVARVAHAPLLAVPGEAPPAMRSAVVGIDFSDASLSAAQAAIRLLDDGGILRIVYVVPKTRTIADDVIPREEEERYLRHRFVQFVGRLTVPAGIAVREVRLDGEPARELLRHAAEVGADFVAVGSHGRGFVERLILGSMTTKLLRGAQCAVLVVPADVAVPGKRDSAHDFTMGFDETRWGEVLDDFTRANIGRRTRLEVDDPELGSQAQERDSRLLGVAYDAHDRRVEIMLGELGAGEPHLSRNITGVEALHILSDIDGRDLALHLRHAGAQTILTLLR